MKPYAAMQPIFRKIPNEDRGEFAGSSFRLWSDNHFLTAGHCVQDYVPEDVGVFDMIQSRIFHCVNIARHPEADLAVLEIEGRVSSQFEKFKLAEVPCTFGENVHCFGALTDWRTHNDEAEAPARVIGGIIQRHFVHRDGNYVTPALEVSVPIPKGMSGGPAFNAKHNAIAVGIAIGTVKSSTFVSTINEFEDATHKETGKISETVRHIETEKISEIIRYGVLLRLFDVTDWLIEILPR